MLVLGNEDEDWEAEYRKSTAAIQAALIARVTYGHDLENVWLLIEANRALGVSNTPLAELYEHLFMSALRYGWDRKAGGFYFRGPLGKSADQRFKPCWAQAEALLCVMQMYSLTGRAMY